MPHPEATRRKKALIDNQQKPGPGVVPAPDPKKGGVTVAPPLSKKAPEEPYSRVAYGVLNMRLTEDQFADLRILRDRTGITIQAHIRRAVLEYLHSVRKEQPDLLAPFTGAP